MTAAPHDHDLYPGAAVVLADLATRVTRLESRLMGEHPDDAIDLGGAARLIGRSISGARKLLDRDADLRKCGIKPGGPRSPWTFSRSRVLKWIEAHR